MEVTHCQLSTRFTDGLCSHNTDSLTDFNDIACGDVTSIALLTDTVLGFTAENVSDVNLFNTCIDDSVGDVFIDEFVAGNNQLVGIRIVDVFFRITSYDTVK